MSTFDTEVTDAARSAIVKLLGSGEWLRVEWSQRVNIKQAQLRAIYDAVDMDHVQELIKDKIEHRIADAIFNSLATEVATDVKKIMSNTELREDCRAVIRKKIRDTADAVT